MPQITATANLLVQGAFLVMLVRRISYIPKLKLRSHGTVMTILTLLLLGSIVLVMLPKFVELYGLLSITVLRGNFSSGLANLVSVHTVFGLITVASAVISSLNWAKFRFRNEEHQGPGRMWGITLAWMLAFPLGLWLFLVLYYFI